MAEFKRKRKKTGGRKAGTPNKATVSAKAAFQFAFDELGGQQGLANWARGNKDEFYRHYARLVPRPIEGTGEDGSLTIKLLKFSETANGR